jgi:hypothetical protein
MAVYSASSTFSKLKEKKPEIVKFVSRKLNLSIEQCNVIPFKFKIIMEEDTSYEDADLIVMFSKLLLKESGYIAEVTTNGDRDTVYVKIVDLEF